MPVVKGHQVLRVFHLQGGCRAVDTEDGRVVIEPSTVEGKKEYLSVRSYASTYADLLSAGIPIVGVEFFTHASEAKGHYPPEWRPYYYGSCEHWLFFTARQKWSQMSYAAFKAKNGDLWDLSSRISHQCEVCSFRLLQISNSYHAALDAIVKRGSYKYELRYEDEYSWRIYLAIQTFLVDACILRDYFAEYSAKYVFCDLLSRSGATVSGMGSFKKHILDKYKGECGDSLFVDLNKAVSYSGWIKLLGEYRDLIVHSAPLIQARTRLFALCGDVALATGVHLPSVVCPIPHEPHAIKKQRTNGEHFEEFVKQFEVCAGLDGGNTPPLDGLDYSYGCMQKLGGLACLLVERSPVAPEMPHFDHTNIIGPVIVKSV